MAHHYNTVVVLDFLNELVFRKIPLVLGNDSKTTAFIYLR